ncbi:hypothetical protein QBC39DRAFT_40329 [Podospora conica]|nr:hypothetical protein QBC39DRAFT_40329 [Schizothecium conicum]
MEPGYAAQGPRRRRHVGLFFHLLGRTCLQAVGRLKNLQCKAVSIAAAEFHRLSRVSLVRICGVDSTSSQSSSLAVGGPALRIWDDVWKHGLHSSHLYFCFNARSCWRCLFSATGFTGEQFFFLFASQGRGPSKVCARQVVYVMSGGFRLPSDLAVKEERAGALSHLFLWVAGSEGRGSTKRPSAELPTRQPPYRPPTTRTAPINSKWKGREDGGGSYSILLLRRDTPLHRLCLLLPRRITSGLQSSGLVPRAEVHVSRWKRPKQQAACGNHETCEEVTLEPRHATIMILTRQSRPLPLPVVHGTTDGGMAWSPLPYLPT